MSSVRIRPCPNCGQGKANRIKCPHCGRIRWGFFPAPLIFFCVPAGCVSFIVVNLLLGVAEPAPEMFGVFLALGIPIVVTGTVLLRSLKKVLTPTIEKMQEEKDVSGLIKTLDLVDEDLRQAAAEALGQIRDARAVESLVAALKDEKADVREAAINALVKIGTPSVTPLVAALKNERVDVREAAIKALVKIGTPSVTPLAAALNNEEPRVRTIAAQTLGQIGDLQAVEPLVAALKHKDYWVREAAVKALGQIGVVEPLLAALKNENRDVRVKTAEMLGKIGDVRAVGPLLSLAREHDENMLETLQRALSQVIERAAPDIALEDLRAVANLEKIEWYIPNTIPANCTMSNDRTVSISYSHVKQLARQELIRRGSQA